MEDKYIREGIEEQLSEIKHILNLLEKTEYEVIHNDDTCYFFTLFSGALKSSSADLLTATAHFTQFTRYNGETE
jgi:hypothetical protein